MGKSANGGSGGPGVTWRCAACTAKRAAKKNVAPYAVYLPLRGETKEGQPIFTSVGSDKKSPIVKITFAATTINAEWRVPDPIVAECESYGHKSWSSASEGDGYMTQYG